MARAGTVRRLTRSGDARGPASMNQPRRTPQMRARPLHRWRLRGWPNQLVGARRVGELWRFSATIT